MALNTIRIRKPFLHQIIRHSSSNSTSASYVLQDSDYEKFLTKISLSREPSAIRSLTPLVNLPGMISLGGGMPNPSTFPFKSISVTLKDGHTLNLTSDEQMTQALQYSATPGIVPLNKKLSEMILTEHNCTNSDVKRSTSITQGSQDGLSKAFDMLLSSESTLLIEDPTYVGSLAYLKPKQCKLLSVKTDSSGLDPEHLESLLKQDGSSAKVLYTIPTGGNPTGCSLSTARKKKIYDLAVKYDLLILEDDPYYYLDFSTTPIESFLSLDTTGRVLRFDSLSKILSSGLRLGTVTGPTALIDRINLHTQASNLHPTGVSQAIVLALLEHWKNEGWEEHIYRTKEFYKSRRDVCLAAMDRHLTGKATWNVPNAGMFVWIKLHGIDDTKNLIETRAALEQKFLMVPGVVFTPNAVTSSYVRASYSTATDEEMDLAMQRLANLLE